MKIGLKSGILYGGRSGRTRLDLAIEYIIPIPVLGKVVKRLVLRMNERELAFAMASVKQILEG